MAEPERTTASDRKLPVRRVKEIIGIPHAEMVAWIKSWGSRTPLPRPKARRLK